jgi:hypothetical protein
MMAGSSPIQPEYASRPAASSRLFLSTHRDLSVHKRRPPEIFDPPAETGA